jgi:hypothetical protein
MDVGNVLSRDVIYIKGVSNRGSGLSLKPGDVVRARVVSSSQGNVVLRIGDARISATSGVPLEQGTIVSLTVTEADSNRVVLKQSGGVITARAGFDYCKDDLIERFLEMAGVGRIESKNAVLTIASFLKGEKIDVGPLFEGLVDRLEDSTVGKPVLANATDLSVALRKAIVGSDDSDKILANIRIVVDALQHENEMLSFLKQPGTGDVPRDLKSLILAVRESLDARGAVVGGPPGDSEAAVLLGSIEKVLQSLNAAGVANMPLQSNTDGFFYLPIPIHCGDSIGTAEIRILKKGGHSGERSSSECPVTVGFMLEMPTLGSTRAFLEVFDGTISFSMAMENLDAVKTAKALSDKLVSSFEGLGYRIGKISIMQMSDKEIEPNGGYGFTNSLVSEKLGMGHEGVDVYG